MFRNKCEIPELARVALKVLKKINICFKRSMSDHLFRFRKNCRSMLQMTEFCHCDFAPSNDVESLRFRPSNAASTNVTIFTDSGINKGVVVRNRMDIRIY